MKKYLSWLIVPLVYAGFVGASYYIPPHGVSLGMHQPGEVFMYGGSACPTGAVAMDGSSLLRAGTYASLFAILSTTYGAADGSHFNVPNAQGVFIRGSGSQTISAVSYTGTRGTTQAQQFLSHNHSASSTAAGTGTSGGAFVDLANPGATGFGGGNNTYSGQQTLTGNGANNLIVTTIGSAGGSETNPANITLLYCIVY